MIQHSSAPSVQVAICISTVDPLCMEDQSHIGTSISPVSFLSRSLLTLSGAIIQQQFKSACSYSMSPYFTLIRSNFSSIGSAANQRKIQVAAAWTASTGKPVT